MPSVAIVTGAASGIGSAVLDALLTSNDDLRCAGFDVAQQSWSAGAIERFGADRVLEVQVDVSDHAAVSRAVARVALSLGEPSILVNAAGIQLNKAALDLSVVEWRRVLGVNLDGTFNCCQHVGRKMVAGGGGAIVNIVSVSMYFGFPGRLPYITSKMGVMGLTQTLAVEWAQAGVRVNAVAPGFVETPLIQEAFAAGHVSRDVAEAQHALARVASPHEIADVVLFLLGRGSSFVTGECIVADGGFRIKKF